MNAREQSKAAKRFADFWAGKGYEKGESQTFWLSLLRDVLGAEHPEELISFEDQVVLDHTSFIDGFIKSTHVLIEQKGLGKDLSKKIKQSDGTMLTPFQQAKRYSAELPYSDRPRWIVISNFAEFHVYDMENPSGEPQVIKLADLPKEYHRLQFLVRTDADVVAQEQEISVKAGELVGKLYNELLKGYVDPTSERALKSLNVLCVRLVFCLYAEDAGLFGRKSMFHDYVAINRDKPFAVRKAVLELFDMLNTKEEDRDPYDDSPASEFPYVNGNLFADTDKLEIPAFTPEIVKLLLTEASEGFDWSGISPTVFGAVFESTLNPETRRKGGMHYTSVENILKVINPLFMDDLNAEFDAIMQTKQLAARDRKLRAFQEKLGSLKFLDPACGSGNFLTETYIQLRRLENKVILELNRGVGQLDFGGEHSPVKVQINQFYGIEVNDFACAVAETALWIAESQMLKETEDIIGAALDFFPLKTNTNIHEGNALRMDWTSVLPKEELSFIMGNPPFVGYAYQSKTQKEDLASVSPEIGKNVDYVAGWYYRAAEIMRGTSIRAAFVSTNSITQGEQVEAVWAPLIRVGLIIQYAYRTFRWDSEAAGMAHVHCVIVGFGFSDVPKKRIFDGDRVTSATNINPYLLDAPNVFIARRTSPLCSVSEMQRGSQPTDDGNLILSEEEKNALVKKYPTVVPFIRPFMMGKDFIERKPRYCLWFADGDPTKILRSCPEVRRRVEAVKAFRLQSAKVATQAKADTPWLFDEIRPCAIDYVAVPKVSSEKRRYVPIERLTSNVIAGDKLFTMPSASSYEFGVLTSSVHMAWMRAVGGRLKSDYSYSNTIVYNNFVWPEVSDALKKKIEASAEAILKARADHPNLTLSDLYDELSMPEDLRKAHRKNDALVLQAYGLEKTASEGEIVSHLMGLYTKKVAEVERREAVEAAVRKVLGKTEPPEDIEALKSKAVAGDLTLEALVEQLKTWKKVRAAEARKSKKTEN